MMAIGGTLMALLFLLFLFNVLVRLIKKYFVRWRRKKVFLNTALAAAKATCEKYPPGGKGLYKFCMVYYTYGGIEFSEDFTGEERYADNASDAFMSILKDHNIPHRRRSYID